MTQTEAIDELAAHIALAQMLNDPRDERIAATLELGAKLCAAAGLLTPGSSCGIADLAALTMQARALPPADGSTLARSANALLRAAASPVHCLSSAEQPDVRALYALASTRHRS